MIILNYRQRTYYEIDFDFGAWETRLSVSVEGMTLSIRFWALFLVLQQVQFEPFKRP